jgi:hypothetical protein
MWNWSRPFGWKRMISYGQLGQTKPAPTNSPYEGWMVHGQQTVFQLGSSSIANHGHYAQLHFLLPIWFKNQK